MNAIEFFEKWCQGKGAFKISDLYELMEAYKTHESKKDFYCEQQTIGFRRSETQCDYCKDKPKIQRA